MEREETCAAIMSEASDNRTKLRELYERLYRIDDALDRLTPRSKCSTAKGWAN